MTPTNLTPTNLTPAELVRYNRQITLPEIGIRGQSILKNSRALIIGLGGLGSSASIYLAAAGVGTLGLVDADQVDTSNMQRQIVHRTLAIGQDKIVSAAETLHHINPLARLRLHRENLAPENSEEILKDYDIALGCLDNFASRLTLDAACVKQNKAHVFGSVSGFAGQTSVFGGNGPCYRCFFRDHPPPDDETTPEQKAVLGTTPGIIGCMMAQETMKILLNLPNTLSGRLLLFDGLAMRFREIPVQKNPDCPVCGKGTP